MKAYHFLREDMTAESGDEPAWKVGETRSIPARRKVIPCEYGYHASPTLFDALYYAPGAMGCIVEIPDDAIPHGDPVDKYAARSRTLVRAVDLTAPLLLFAADCAERILPIFESAYPNNDLPRKAIEAARAYAQGEIDEAAVEAAWAPVGAPERAAAGAAAWAAAGAAVWEVAWVDERQWQRNHFNATVLPILEATTRA
jgi:hypothetical protein